MVSGVPIPRRSLATPRVPGMVLDSVTAGGLRACPCREENHYE